MEINQSDNRGNWSSKVGFILAAAGSAIGLGNIWAYPSKVADNGGAAFILIYILCVFLVGFPIMVSELTIGRKTGKNPVGAFKAFKFSPHFKWIGFWGIVCGFMILAFYNVVAGWTFSYVFEEIFHYFGNEPLKNWFADLGNGHKNAIFSAFFMLLTIAIITGGVAEGIEKATKIMMPMLFAILIIMIGFVFTREGAVEGLVYYLKPDFSKITFDLFFKAMGQAFFSLSLGMGALITYGSYLNKKSNIPEAAFYVTMSDLAIAFLAGLLIIPAMFVAHHNGVNIFDQHGNLLSSTSLVFTALPDLFHSMQPFIGLVSGVMFFLLLSMAALTSTISLLEVPVSYVIDEFKWKRKRAAIGIGLAVLSLSLVISYDLSLIDLFALLFNDIGLPLGGLLISIFLAYVWKTNNAMAEIRSGYSEVDNSFFGKLWPFMVKYVSPLLIGIVFFQTIYSLFS
ncbi:sodium-dependent transporter [bacterium]|nr:MAG: sodium-dependent transporter [bacterium]